MLVLVCFSMESIGHIKLLKFNKRMTVILIIIIESLENFCGMIKIIVNAFHTIHYWDP